MHTYTHLHASVHCYRSRIDQLNIITRLVSFYSLECTVYLGGFVKMIGILIKVWECKEADHMTMSRFRQGHVPVHRLYAQAEHDNIRNNNCNRYSVYTHVISYH